MWACSGCVVERKNEKKKGKDGCGLFLGALSKGWKRRKKKKEKGGPGQIQVRYKIDENAKRKRNASATAHNDQGRIHFGTEC